MKKKTLPLLEYLEKTMHNWFWLGIIYDWKKNTKTGKMWVYKDCTGIFMQAKNIDVLEQWLRSYRQ